MSWLSKVMSALRRDSQRRMPESEFVVQYDDRSVTLSHPRRGTQAVLWSDLQEVEIVTTDDSPWACDWYWLLHGATSGIAVPQGATGEATLLERLQRLPAFDNEAVIQASARSDNHRVICWKRHTPTAEPGAPPNAAPPHR